MISEHIETAKIWETGQNSGLGLFATMEIIIDEKHRSIMSDEIQARLSQVAEHRSMLEVAVDEQKNLENLLTFTQNSTIVVDN